MKYILIAIAAVVLLLAESQTMTQSEHSSIHSASNRPSLKLRKKQNMHSLHKIDEKKAAELIKNNTGEEVTAIKLTHRGQYLLYKARTKSYSVELNAMDAAFIKKSKHE